MTGIGVYFALQHRNALAKAGYILLGYVGAVIMHGLWNGSSLVGLETYFAVYVLWMVPIFVLAIVLGVRSRRREQRIVAEKLPGMVAAGLVTPNEATWLGSMRNRKTAIGHAARIGGKPARQGCQELRRPGGRTRLRARSHRSRLRRRRVIAMQNEEAYAVHAARAAAPALQGLTRFQAPPVRP